MNTKSAHLDLIGSQSDWRSQPERPSLFTAAPDGDQSRRPDKTAEPWPGVAPPAGWFLRAARVTAPPQGPVSAPSSADREPGEPRIETGPGDQAPVPGPADPALPPLIPAPRRGWETSIWQRSYHLWTESGIAWQRGPAAEPPAPGTGYAGRHARAKQRRQADVAEPPAFVQFLGAPVDLGRRPAAGGGTLLLERPPLTLPPLADDLPESDEAQAEQEPHRSRLVFGRRVLALGVPVLVLAMVATAAVALLTGHGPNAARVDNAANITTSFPAYPGLHQRGVFESATRIVVYGTTAVVTAQVSADPANPDGARQRFFVSTHGGVSWRLAQVQGSAAGNVAPLVAGGAAGWVAIGPHAIWTSSSGTSWTLRSAHGLGLVKGDQVQVVTATSAGFLAGGRSAGGEGVVWTSPDGVTWHRTAPALGATSISYATAHGDQILVAGPRPDGTSGAWLSTDGGASWAEVSIPVTHGAAATIAGVAWDSAGLLAVRDGAAGDAITFFSPNGRSWHYAGTLGASGGLRPRVVKGNGYGLVVAGQDSTGQLVAYRGADVPQQATWRPTANLGNAAAEAVVGAAVAPGDSVIAIGATAATPITQQPVVVRATADAVTPVALPAEQPELAVSAVAQAAGVQLAVGSADGYPAIWRRQLTAGRWSPWSLMTSPAQFGQQQLGTLTSVTHGPSAWLAAGRAGAGSLTLTSPDGVTWHVA